MSENLKTPQSTTGKQNIYEGKGINPGQSSGEEEQTGGDKYNVLLYLIN